MSRVIRPCGDHALLVEFDDPADLAAAAATWRASPPLDVLDVVPAARTILLDAAPGTDLVGLRRAAGQQLDLPEAEVVSSRSVEIPVVYDGADLTEVARLTGLSPDEVVAAHTGRPWRVAFCGFAPGFGYLVDGDPRLRVTRRATPRTRVPAGSVGLAGNYSGVYPRPSPGGWQLIGRTSLVLFDVDQSPPALLGPGVIVRFIVA